MIFQYMKWNSVYLINHLSLQMIVCLWRNEKCLMDGNWTKIWFDKYSIFSNISWVILEQRKDNTLQCPFQGYTCSKAWLYKVTYKCQIDYYWTQLSVFLLCIKISWISYFSKIKFFRCTTKCWSNNKLKIV